MASEGSLRPLSRACLHGPHDGCDGRNYAGADCTCSCHFRLSPADELAADELENPGGMTWREVKDFLDHMRETCIKDRQELKLEVRRLRGLFLEVERHCPCGARPESPNTHPHVTGCPVGDALHPRETS